jgi:hypothetical protein
MKKTLLSALVLLVGSTAAAEAQEYDVSRRSYPFLEERLTVLVETEVPGTLRVLRGGRGQVEVAGRSPDGFVGFGLGGDIRQHLRLTSVGGAHVEYLVVVPEHVRLTVQLPDRAGTDVAPRQESAVFRWGLVTGKDENGAALLLPTHGGMYRVHTSTLAPAFVDIPDLASVRSISVRFGPGDFRIASSRPLSFDPGSGRAGIVLRVAGDPTAIVINVPTGTPSFTVRAADRTLVSIAGGRPGSNCAAVAVQQPTREQMWFNFYPQRGRIECR